MTLFRRQLIRRRGEGAGPQREIGSSQTRVVKGRVHLLWSVQFWQWTRLTHDGNTIITRISVNYICTVIIASPILPLSQTDMAANYCV